MDQQLGHRWTSVRRARTWGLLVAMAGCAATPTASTGTVDTCAGAASGHICTVVGNGTKGYDGGGKHRLESWLYYPMDLALDKSGTPYLLDWNNHRVRRVNADDTLESVMGTEDPGDGDPGKKDLTSAGAPGTSVSLNHPSDLFFETRDTPVAHAGDLVLDAWHNHRLRTWTPTDGLVHVTCGMNPGFGGDGKKAGLSTQFNQPSKVTQDKDGNTYLIDMRNWRIRRIGADGMVSTVAGNGKPGAVGDESQPQPADKANFLFFYPQEWSNPEVPGGGIAVSPDGATLYIADSENHRIRAIDLAAKTIRTIAGSGTSGCVAVDPASTPTACANDQPYPPSAGAFAGDGGPATQAKLNSPHDLAFGPDGRLYFADTLNHRIRAIDLTTGIIQTVVGNGATPTGVKPFPADQLGDGGTALQGTLNRPMGLTFDAAGNMYIADTYNQRIRKVLK